MSQPETVAAHQVEPDGWCWTCRMPKCQGDAVRPRPQSPMAAQMTRIELKQNQLMRHLGMDGERSPAEIAARMCHWTQNLGEAQAQPHEDFHFGYPCPYEAVAAVLRGEPDPREPIESAWLLDGERG